MAGRDTEELYRMIQGKKTGQIQISEIEALLSKNDTYAKCTAVQAVARIGGRDAYGKLIAIIRNETENDVINSAIIAMAQTNIAPDTKDSRMLFPLVNLYNNASEYQTKVNILNALSAIKDPRTMDFLEQILLTEKKNIQDVIESCMHAQNIFKEFKYTFTKADEPDMAQVEKIKTNAENAEKKRIQINHYSNIPALPIYIPSLRHTADILGPLTYIIDENKKMFIGANTEEHVETAKSANVIAAGEISFTQHTDGTWELIELNNRSNGYFPARTSFPIVAKVLEKAEIKHSGQFSYLHPRDGFFSDEFLSMFPFHPQYEEKHFGKRKKD